MKTIFTLKIKPVKIRKAGSRGTVAFKNKKAYSRKLKFVGK